MKTSTKTFGKEAKSLVKEVFPTAKKIKVHGRNKMYQLINIYDNEGKHLGYWTNQDLKKGEFRRF